MCIPTCASMRAQEILAATFFGHINSVKLPFSRFGFILFFFFRRKKLTPNCEIAGWSFSLIKCNIGLKFKINPYSEIPLAAAEKSFWKVRCRHSKSNSFVIKMQTSDLKKVDIALRTS